MYITLSTVKDFCLHSQMLALQTQLTVKGTQSLLWQNDLPPSALFIAILFCSFQFVEFTENVLYVSLSGYEMTYVGIWDVSSENDLNYHRYTISLCLCRFYDCRFFIWADLQIDLTAGQCWSLQSTCTCHSEHSWYQTGLFPKTHSNCLIIIVLNLSHGIYKWFGCDHVFVLKCSLS